MPLRFKGKIWHKLRFKLHWREASAEMAQIALSHSDPAATGAYCHSHTHFQTAGMCAEIKSNGSRPAAMAGLTQLRYAGNVAEYNSIKRGSL